MIKRLTLVVSMCLTVLLISSCGGGGTTGGVDDSGSGDSGTFALTSPNGGETWYAQSETNPTITWTQSGAGNSVRIELYKSGSLFLTLTVATENDGTYSLEIPSSTVTSGDYTVKIVSYMVKCVVYG